MQTAKIQTGIARPTTGTVNTIGAGLAPTSLSRIPEGKYTSTVYSLISAGRYEDVITLFKNEIESSATAKTSRAALSLLAYCYYHVQDFYNAALMLTSFYLDTSSL
jgi:tetratricopeptide repeat protein 30